MGGVYRITCISNGKIYIGSTLNFDDRWYKNSSSHTKLARLGKHHSTHFQRAWDKYGESSFKFEIIETLTDPQQNILREQYWLDYYQSYDRSKGFNLQPNAQSSLGYKRSPEFCKACSERFKGRKASDGTRTKMSLAHQGSKNKCAKLDEKVLLDVFDRMANGESQAHLARELNVSKTTLNSAIRGRAWKHMLLPPNLPAGNATGDKHGMSKFSWTTVSLIKADLADGQQPKTLATKYGISRQSITDIKFGRTWKKRPT